MASRTANIIRTLYGNEIYPEKRPSLLSRLFSRSKRPLLRKHDVDVADVRHLQGRSLPNKSVIFVIGTAFLSVHFAVAIVYYNRLTSLEQDVLASSSMVETVLQRRQNIAVHLVQAVREYAVHEQAIFNHVSDTRMSPPETTGSRPGGETVPAERDPDPNLRQNEKSIFEEAMALLEGSGKENILTENKMARLVAIAEQYPDLKLSENFRSYMTALVETERDLNRARDEHATAVNSYEKQLKTFPGKLFATYYGFRDYPHFLANTEARRFEPDEGGSDAEPRSR